MSYNTITTGGFFDSASWSTQTDHLSVPRIKLEGENADIVINGVSLKESIALIESRLAILKPNPELESRWDRLRELREEYQRLEAEIIEKEKMWDRLKK